MASIYRHEPLIAATRMTAAVNLSILRTQAAAQRRTLSSAQIAAAVLMAVQFEKVVREYGTKRTTP